MKFDEVEILKNKSRGPKTKMAQNFGKLKIRGEERDKN